MTRCRVLWTVWLYLASLGCVFADALPPDLGPEYAAAERQIMVMLPLAPPHFRPDADYVPGYDPRSGSSALQRVADQLAAEYKLRFVARWPMPALGVDCLVMEVPPNDSAARLVDLLSRDPRVESVQRMNLFRALGHNDPLYPLQPSAKLWRLAQVHEVATGRHTVVAEIDTGVEIDHPDLHGQVALEKNFVDGSAEVADAHGTAVAGIIAARADNALGIVGIAPRARLMILRACWHESGVNNVNLCSSYTLAKAVQFALDRNVHVINLSLSGPRDRLLERLLDAAMAQGITVVSAADSRADNGGFPASHPGVVAVAGDETRSAPHDVLLAPGQDIPTTLPGGRWGFVSGSSFAAAHVTGLVALLHELAPQLRPQQVRSALVSTRVTGLAADVPEGVDACSAIMHATSTCACDCASIREARSLRP